MTSRFGTSFTDETRRLPCPIEGDASNGLAVETLEELEWCLERLESIQTHRSVSDMASSKFKKMLNKELSQVYDGDRINSQISEYICSTFLDQDEQTADSQQPAGSGIFVEVDPLASASGVASDGASAAEQTTITAATGADFRKLQQQNQNQPGSSVIIRVDRNTAEEIAAAAASAASKRPSGVSLGASRSPGRFSDHSCPSIPSILGVNGSVTGIGVDPSKVFQLGAGHRLDDSAEIPPYGIIPEHPKEASELIECGLDQWGMDIFKLAELTISPLTCVTYTILKRRGLINKFKIPHWNLVRYLRSVEAHYNTYTPYHNKIHAADVVQSVHVLLQAPALDSVFTDLELAAVIIACAVHDVNHPGVTNQYLVNTNDALAILYNDSSVLENYHLAVAFNLLTFPGCDILVNLTRKQRLAFRRMVIDMVLSTDMSKHMSLLADLKTMVETKKVAGSGILNLDNYTDRMQILQNMVHCADLSNTAKPLELYTKWTHRLMDEFFLQGDRERAAGLDISPMCDRETATVENSQVSFIDFISHPLWETWSDLVHPAAQGILEMLEYNRNWYFNLSHSDDHHHHHQQQPKEDPQTSVEKPT
uniref:Phosphodiesterase n=1 Tax=Mesocestoides corti TaxID=53468 RepID=A0A5K3F0R1_MESCO